MTESRKRTAANSPMLSNSTKVKRPAPTRPAVVGTKASLARAKAVNAQLTATASKPLVNRKRKAEEPKTLARSYKTTAEGLKERPAWDLRGKVSDMTKLYEMNLQRLEELRKFKRELEITKDTKESEEKEALQKAAALRTKLQEIERQHSMDIEDLHARQRIESQQLEDDSLNYSRKLTTIEIEVSDAKRKLDRELEQLDQFRRENRTLRESIEETSMKLQNVDADNRALDKDIEELDKALANKNKETQKKQKDITIIDKNVEELRFKLAEADKDRERLQNKIRAVELKKKSAGNNSVSSIGNSKGGKSY